MKLSNLTRTIVIVCVGLLIGCTSKTESETGVKRVNDDDNRWEFNRRLSYRLTIGTGSGKSGYETIDILNSGRVVEHRFTGERGFERAVYEIPDESVQEIAQLLKLLKIESLAKEYHLGLSGGTQGILVIRQGENLKRSYFNNYFPELIVKFINDVRKIVQHSRIDEWEPVRGREHERSLYPTK